MKYIQGERGKILITASNDGLKFHVDDDYYNDTISLKDARELARYLLKDVPECDECENKTE